MARGRKPAPKKSGGTSVIGLIVLLAVPVAIYVALPKESKEAVKDKASKSVEDFKEGFKAGMEGASDPMPIDMSKSDIDALATKIAKERIKKFWNGEFDEERFQSHMDRIKPKVVGEIKMTIKVKRINRDEYQLPKSLEEKVVSRLTSNAQYHEVRDSLVREILESEKSKAAARKKIDSH